MDAIVQNPIFRTYFFYSSILVIKLMFMSIFTGRMRVKHQAFVNPEDAVTVKGKVKTDENVERVRRAHLNDLENIVPFFVIGFIYTLTNPSVTIATLLFRLFTGARIIHTLVYAVFVVPQPARAIAFIVGYVVTGYMAIQSIIYFAS